MKASSIIVPLVALGITANAADVSPQDINFLTALVNDFQSHKTDYIQFFATATSVPGDLAPLATRVLTYTDDSYTTLLAETSINIPELQSYVTKLPWHTRIQFDATGANNAATPNGTGNVIVATITRNETHTGTPTGTEATETGTVTSPSPTGDHTGTETAHDTTTGEHTEHTTTTTPGAGAIVSVPIGAIIGAVAVAIL